MTDAEFEWEERAAIIEFDGGLSREVAEALATFEQWLNPHPPRG